MCGRFFYVLDEQSKEGKWIQSLSTQLSLFQFEQGEIFPSQTVLALVNQNDIKPTTFTWGLNLYQNRLINARSETIHEKKTFQKMVMNRCAIPCNGFYEWKNDKHNKHKYFIHTSEETFYLAGLFEQDKLVILTGASQHDMKSIHHRTPLIMSHVEMIQYLKHEQNAIVHNENLIIEKENS